MLFPLGVYFRGQWNIYIYMNKKLSASGKMSLHNTQKSVRIFTKFGSLIGGRVCVRNKYTSKQRPIELAIG